MKGFIEVTNGDGDKEFVNADKIFSIANSIIYYSSDGDDYLRVKETYAEIKALIEDGASIQCVSYVPHQEPQVVPLPYHPTVPLSKKEFEDVLLGIGVVGYLLWIACNVVGKMLRFHHMSWAEALYPVWAPLVALLVLCAMSGIVHVIDMIKATRK